MRFVNRILAALVALALVIVGALVVIEVIAVAAGRHPAVVHWRPALFWARRTSWDSSGLQISCIVLAAIGLVLLVLQLKPRRPSRLGVDSAATDAAFTRRGVAAAVHSAVDDVDGVSGSSVRVRRSRVMVRATTGQSRESAQALGDTARAAAQARIDDLELRSAPKLRLHLAPRES